MNKLWIVEKRNPDASLDFSKPQPEDFGIPASGLDDWQLSRIVYRHASDATVLTGDSIAIWPTHLDPAFIARPKTWR